MTEPVQPSKHKPARKQVDAPVTAFEETHAPGTFNIWTGRKLKEFRSKDRKPREASKYRCRPKLDSGWTRGAGMDVSYCCMYFARGLCHHGSDCNYLHRVPTESDEARLRCDYGHDIFGRERTPASRDGRKKGVGSYERECRTLYIHYGGAGPLPGLKLHQLLQENFAEWGPIEDIHVVPDKTIAFVRYNWRSSAEFAKVAMHQQSLDGSTMGEVLDVRWANDDPNPRAVDRVKREREEAFRDAYMQAVTDLPPEQKQARLHQLNMLANVRPGCTTSQYPDTSSQYGGRYSHDYQGWDQYYEQLGQQSGPPVDDEDIAEQQRQSYQQHFYSTGQHQYGAWAGGVKGHVGAPWQGEDDVSRYLPAEAWQQEQPGGQLRQVQARTDAVSDDDTEIPPELLEFTPDLIEGHAMANEPVAGAAPGPDTEVVPAPIAASDATATVEQDLGFGILNGDYASSSDDDDKG